MSSIVSIDSLTEANHELPRSRERRMADDLSAGLVVCVVGLVLCAILALAFLLYAPTNPMTLNLSGSVQMAARQAFPQGWGFFTKSPQDDYFLVFRRANGQWVNAFDGPSGEPKNLFGLSRLPRAEGVEMGLLTSLRRDKPLLYCQDDFAGCVGKLPPAVIIDDPAPTPVLCGHLLIVMKKPVPWNWAKFAHVTMPSHILNLVSNCR
jgi:antimicrobial peptide system SdpA family protein